jgi:hypothetical protein
MLLFKAVLLSPTPTFLKARLIGHRAGVFQTLRLCLKTEHRFPQAVIKIYSFFLVNMFV